MTFVKFAVLGGVALAATMTGARAESAAELAAKVEALELRLSQFEEEAVATKARKMAPDALNLAKAPQIVAPGEKLGPNEAAMVNTFSILPTADVYDGGGDGLPSSAAAQWTGHVKAAFVYEKVELLGTVTDSTHIVSSTELNLKAVNDTAVGEVGVHVRFAAEADGQDISGGGIDRAYGWWKLTPEMTLKAGYKNSIGGVGHGMDKCECNFTDVAGVVGSIEEDATQFELRYGSGPIEAAVAVEHRDYDDDFGATTGHGQSNAIAAEVKWSGDSVSAEVSGFWGQAPANSDGDDYNDTEVDIWQVGTGVSFGMDAFSLSGAAGYGEVEELGYWEASVLAGVSLTDSVNAELGVGYSKAEDLLEVEVMGVAGGVYWSPVDKLTIGAEGSWKSESWSGTTIAEDLTADLVTVFKF